MAASTLPGGKRPFRFELKTSADGTPRLHITGEGPDAASAGPATIVVPDSEIAAFSRSVADWAAAVLPKPDAVPHCDISGCDQHASCWFEELHAPSKTFYLCADHFLQATNAEGEAVILDPVTGRFETRLIGSDIRRLDIREDSGQLPD